MRRIASITIIALVGVASASIAARYLRGNGPVPAFNTAPVTRGSLVETVSATGTLQAVVTVEVGTQVSGMVKELLVDFNDTVTRGQVLARLEPSLFQTQVEQARANLARAQADVERLQVARADAQVKLERARQLSARELIAATELEAADVNLRSADAQLAASRASVTQARAALNHSQVNLQHTIIRAPIDGIVVSRNVDVGQTVAASMSAPTLYVLAADLTRMQVNASIDEADVGRVKEGQPVRFRVDAFPNREFEGAVKQVRLQPTTEQNVVTYTTVISAPNPDLLLKPGMTASVSLELARADAALQVPASALRFRPTEAMFEALGQEPIAVAAQDSHVWMLAGGSLRPISVRAGLSSGTHVAVDPVGAETLAPGTQVVTGVATAVASAGAAGSGAQNPFVPAPPRSRSSGSAGATRGASR